MQTIQEQFTFQELNQHFEKDTHLDVRQAEIERLEVLNGETPVEDILVVIYKSSPNLSFYDTRGRLIDVDHYLPDNFREHDAEGAESIIENLKNIEPGFIKSKNSYKRLLEESFQAGQGNLALGLYEKFGLVTTAQTVEGFKKWYHFEGDNIEFEQFLLGKYPSFHQFLVAFILFQQQTGNGYVHITSKKNIVITTLNKRSGLAVIMETSDVDDKLLPPNKWTITRTQDPKKLEQALVFRTEDVKAFFNADGYERNLQTDRYKLFFNHGNIAIDSLVDNTDNLLKLELINNCYQVLASDENILLVLSNEQELTIVNTHLSVVPHKWPKKILLPDKTQWMRVDENLQLLFAQSPAGMIKVLDISQDHPEEIASLGSFSPGFEIDQNGHLILCTKDAGQLIKIKTNANDIIPPNQKNFSTVFSNLSHLFKGESLFTKTRFAKKVSEQKKQEKEKLPTAIEVARYDFETNIEHMLVKAKNDYKQLLDIQNKVAIARQNIAEELTSQAEKEGIFLVGQRLQSTINKIIRPAEKKIRNLVEITRAIQILTSMQSFKDESQTLKDPNTYREILNNVRKYEEELGTMLPENIDKVFSEFKLIQQELNASFSDQIVNDGTSLQKFILGEIEQVEKAISNTHLPKQLEILLSTHPAALELMALLKQPFVLQNIAAEMSLSPSGIQHRLHESVEKRRLELRKEVERKEAERNAAKLQFADMIKESIAFFVKNHSGGFSDLELSANAGHEQILNDINKLENNYGDVRLGNDLRRRLERRILERNREDLEKMVAFEGKYAFIKNDPDLFIDLESTLRTFPSWEMELIDKRDASNDYLISFIRDSDREVYRPSTSDNLRSGKAFEISEDDYSDFSEYYRQYADKQYSHALLSAIWQIHEGRESTEAYPQFTASNLKALAPKSRIQGKALRCALEKKKRESLERTRSRKVPKIGPEFIDETPYFQEKLNEFVIKAKLQLVSGSGIILLSGPPSTGKSAFLKFIAAIMNREYFEHASDKWQTKNSLVSAIKFGEYGPYTIPAGFTKAITTPHSLVNIEEIKEWPEALRKSLNPFFAGSKEFIAPDGTAYQIGDNILLCAAANLGSMYRQDDEPFTADFWSRIEVVEYEYAPQHVSRDYFDQLHQPRKNTLISMQELVRDYFHFDNAPDHPERKAIFFSKQFLEFTLLPKADEKIKRENLHNHINEYFERNLDMHPGSEFGPEEAAKVALRRLKDFQGYSATEFFDLYDHFINGQNLRSRKLAALQTSDIEKYEHLKVLLISLRYLEGCLRHLREMFYTSAGQTEIEGTNREFIKCVLLLGLIGKI